MTTLCPRSHYAREMHHSMCPIMHVPEEMHHCIVPKEIHHRICPILTYARRIALLHALDILCVRRNAPLHMLDTACARYYIMPEEVHHCIVLDIACARRNASSHCARDCIVPEVCISSRLHRARILQVPESNQVISINRCQKQIRSLYSLLISQRRHPPKASSFIAYGLHVMA